MVGPHDEGSIPGAPADGVVAEDSPDVAGIGEAQEIPPAVSPDSFMVVYIHGIGNKPVASVLKCQWDRALFGVEMGDRSRLAYWRNTKYYPTPLAGTCGDEDRATSGDVPPSPERVRVLTQDLDFQVHAADLAGDDPERARILQGIANKMQASALRDSGELAAGGVAAADVETKILPLPPFVRRWVTQEVTRTFLRDVNDFLFDEGARRVMEDSLRERLSAGGGPFVVVAHSQGTMIAYNVLRQLPKDEYDIPLFVTIGSPLGIAEVQDVLRRWTGGELPVPDCVGKWVNIAAWLDPVAADMGLANDFTPGRKISDHRVINPDLRSPHSGTGYLRTPQARRAVRDVVGPDFTQAVSSFVIARDLVGELEDAEAAERRPVLIQLSEREGTRLLREVGRELVLAIEDVVGGQSELAQVDQLQRYVAAELTRQEVERLAGRFTDLRLNTIWRNASKTALIHVSTHTIQARPANRGYDANGRGVCWAVLDTGIAANHPHFQVHGNITAEWDCTGKGAPAKGAADRHGHGTHVAGIIAGGEVGAPVDGESAIFAGMAPEAKLHIYKVLDDQGQGRDSWIIKALDHIANVNEQTGELIIHGVNLSLGGPFDQSVYGCGHTPLCDELRRLWRQGVVVCLAAGNEGFQVLQAAAGEVDANMDLSIGDPANLEEAISVGSVHKSRPHTYGISYFSSRGPTADGRMKPDVVAPGERILSCAYNFGPPEPLYVEMSGTSMATPHVSGMLAAFLSRHQEFIGRPDDVKATLLGNSTDLKRDPYMQGRGLPNLVRMLANT